MNSRTTKFLRIFILFAALTALLWLVGSTQLTQAADPVWSAQYWNNKTLSGSPVLSRTENNLNFDWGTGSPSPGVVNSDNFSAYWRRSVNFTAGNYTFTATTDDGIRVWVDGALIIDSWTDSQVHSIARNISLTSGDHLIEVRYYEAGGQAVAKLSWSQTGSAPPPTITNFRGEYFNNISLSGSPVLIRDDSQIDFDWGIGSPDSMVPADRFSVRWTRTQAIQSGRYRFTVIADDGVRLWINGQLVVDKWLDSYEGTYLAEVDIPGGSVNVQMEYYENVGGAVARLSWLRIGDSSGGGSGSGSNWRGEYFNNQGLSGSPALVRDDGSLNFNWGAGSPSPGVVNNDHFSARWSRSMYFSAGRYRFTVTADDGVRVWVNNQQIINAWYDQAPTTYNGEIDLSSATVPVRVEYYEGVGGARISLSWSLISSPPTPPTPPPSSGEMYGIVQSPRLNVRTGPGLQYGVIDQLVEDDQVTLVGYRSADNGWVMIEWQGGRAWVSGRPGYLWTNVPVSSLTVWQGEGSPPPGGGTGGVPTGQVVNCLYLNVRSGPGVSNGVVTVIPAGTIVTLIGRNSSSTWTKIQLTSGTIGWVSTTYLNESVPLSTLPVVN